MNCQECRQQTAAYLEGLLDETSRARMDAHLDGCTACEAELREVHKLTSRLASQGPDVPPGCLAGGVMDRILQEQTLLIRRLKMRKRIRVFGVSGATVAALVLLFFTGLWLAEPAEAQRAAEMLARGAEAASSPSTVHIKAKMRTLPGDNFSLVGADYEFVPVEIWYQFGKQPRWRVEKPGRVAVMDGVSAAMLMRPDELVRFPRPCYGAFDTGWLLALTRIKGMITHELRVAQAKKWDMSLSHETTAAGEQTIVTVEAKSGLPDDDYLKNKFFDDSDMRRVYRFDAKTQRLEGFDAYMHRDDGDVKILAVERIEYDKPIDPEVFKLRLPETVHLCQPPQRLPDNERYEKMTPKEAAQSFFEACSKKDWDEVRKFYSPCTERTKEYLGGLKLVSLGKPFQSKVTGNWGWFVPYEVKLSDGTVKKHNLALRNDNKAKRFIVGGGTP